MTIKDAILKSLEDFPKGATAREVYKNIIEKSIFTFNKEAKTPGDTVSACLSTMIKKQDVRVRRFENDKNVFCYVLQKYASDIALSNISRKTTKNEKIGFHERSLHPLLCNYLSNFGIMAKTIFHEKSTKAEEHQKWIHPDIVGVSFTERSNHSCNALFKAISKRDSMCLYSYELKKSINNDYDLKKCFFQAVSNSSWANYGYLVSFEIDENLKDELERLNHSFGIGFILLKSNPAESVIWFQAKYKPIDFNTMDKLCDINKDFEKFTTSVEATLTADDKHFNSSKDALIAICDEFPISDEEIRNYCTQKNIPIAAENE